MSENALVRLENITKSFDGEEVLSGLNLTVRDEEFLTLLGPSGCGKTTTLRLIAGFEYPTAGKIYFEGKDITDIPPHKRKVNTVFQKYALFPFLNIYENIAFGLRIKKLSEKEISRKVQEMLELVNLKGFEKRSVSSLSGGQQQRVAIARALVNHPQLLLLDEPLGALDLKLRKGMQTELKNIQQQLGITFVYVTHDQEEALTMSDTIIVMNKGIIQQIGTPQDIYNEPNNAFVADFIGESNIIPGIMRKDYLVTFEDVDFVCVDKGFAENEPIDVVIRPEDIQVVSPADGQLSGLVESVTFKGVHYEMAVMIRGKRWLIHSTDAAEADSVIGIHVDPDEIHIMKRSEENLMGEEGMAD